MIGKELRLIDPQEITDVQSAQQTVRRKLARFIDMPEAIPSLIEKRMEKILRYLGES
jgi:hypothetical protein